MSEILLDAYAARSCPVKTHNAFDPTVSIPAVESKALWVGQQADRAAPGRVRVEQYLLRGFKGVAPLA